MSDTVCASNLNITIAAFRASPSPAEFTRAVPTIPEAARQSNLLSVITVAVVDGGREREKLAAFADPIRDGNCVLVRWLVCLETRYSGVMAVCRSTFMSDLNHCSNMSAVAVPPPPPRL
ncbi:hypothetical protein J6590_006176 [Homalodisca vitripennis]|nr:hypothetical protein J6590_006176 [Homalodisca vitripennis]